jgi:predicted ATP-dependent endonuclease of OLD family
MAELLLDSLEIKNFRIFDHLQIEKLGRVNLIVGKNGVGKTALLEAVWLYSNRGLLNNILALLERHKEFNFIAANDVSLKTASSKNLVNSLRYLFHNVPKLEESPSAQIGSKDDAKKLVLELRANFFNTLINPSFGVNLGVKPVVQYHFDRPLERLLSATVSPVGNELLPNNFLQTSHLAEDEINELWNKIVVTHLEIHVVKALQLLYPDIERVAVVKDEGMQNVYVGFKNSDRRVTLASLGEGLNQVFQIVLTLVNSKDGLLLVDEIENGLHRTVQPDLWRMIFRLAHELNVQVFATTHSWDCVEAFQEAAEADPHEEAMLIRLQNKGGRVVPISIDENMLKNVVEQEVEIR